MFYNDKDLNGRPTQQVLLQGQRGTLLKTSCHSCSLKKKVILTTDASGQPFGGVLSQEGSSDLAFKEDVVIYGGGQLSYG